MKLKPFILLLTILTISIGGCAKPSNKTVEVLRGSSCCNIISSEMQDCQQTAPQTDKGCTYNGWRSIADNVATPIDYCFASKKNGTPLSFEICRDKWNEVNYLSDHYPIKAKIEVIHNTLYNFQYFQSFGVSFSAIKPL